MSKSTLLSLAAIVLVAVASFVSGAYVWFQRGQEVSEALNSQALMHAEYQRSQTRHALEVLHQIRGGDLESAVQALELQVKAGLNPPKTAHLIAGNSPLVEAVEANQAPTSAMLSSAAQYQTRYCAGSACLGIGP